MKNLKKVLALGLSAAMALSMFVTGAGAAFTDQADIKQTEAVDMLSALGVIEGNPDGSFKPDATVTRAEMAKMIYVLRTGKSDASTFASANSSFTDITGHWAAGYIKYCQSMGIIAGKSATMFAPEETVTGQEAAKMLLVTLGYNAERAGLVGTGWDKKTVALSDENGLLDDVDSPMSMGLPRQYAAQIMFNAIDAPTVKWRDDEYSNTNVLGTDNETIGEKYMGLKKTTGTMDSFVKTSGKDTFEMTITNVDEDKSSDKYLTGFQDIKADYSSLKYQTVKVLYKEKDKVYGVYATDDNENQTGLLADLKTDGDKVKLDGTKYNLAKETSVYVDGELQTKKDGDKTVNVSIYDWVDANKEGNSTYEKGSKVQLLATDGSTNYSILNVTTYKVAEVTFVGSDYVTAGKKYESDDYNIADDIKKNDYVVISSKGNYADDKGVVEKAQVVEGKIVGTKGDNKVQIEDTWYTTNASLKGNSALRMSANLKLVLVNDFIYAIDTVSAGSTDVALVAQVGENNKVGSKYYQARLILADGTDKVVDIEKKDGNDKAIDSENFDNYADTLATYDVSKDVYTLTFVGATELAGYDNLLAMTSGRVDGSMQGTFTVTGGSLKDAPSKVYFDDNAVVFVRYKTDDYKVVTGKTAKNWDKVDATKASMLTNLDKNAQYAQVAFVDLGKNKVPGGSSTTYAVALDDSYTRKESGTTYTFVKGWNGSEEKEYKYEGTLSGGVSKGDIFEYSADGDDTYDLTIHHGTSTKVVTYDDGGDIVFDKDITNQAKDKSNLKIDSKDTVVLYVDSDAKTGETDGEIQEAAKYNGDENNEDNNVIAFIESEDEECITVLVVDVNNNMKW